MHFLPKASQRVIAATWIIAALCLATAVGRAEDFRLESAGARYGFSSDDRSDDFKQAEAFLNWNLPWRWDLGSDWDLQSRLDLSAGWLGGDGEDGAIGTVGPSLVLARGGWPLSLEGGLSPTLLSRFVFGPRNFGNNLQFTSHVGLNLDLGPHLRLDYRYQHMSNAGLSSPNPGLNLHFFALSYRF